MFLLSTILISIPSCFGRPSGVLPQDVIVLLNLMLEVECMMFLAFAHIAFAGM